MLQTGRNVNPVSQPSGGFTLVEILVVIVVIGILAAVAVPIFLDQSDKADDAALKSDLANATRILQVAEASGEPIPASPWNAGEVVDLGSAGTFTPVSTLTVSGSGSSLCVEGTSGSGDVYSSDVENGLRNYDCDGNVNGAEPLVLSYADTAFTSGSDNETLTATIAGGDGSTAAYSVTGSLPAGVTFDETTGAFTGPADSEWNLTVTEVAAGSNHTCALIDDGSVKCWGANWGSQLGDGTTTDSLVPVTVVAEGEQAGGEALTGVAHISGVHNHTCALLDNGAVKCWGSNSDGQLGDGTTNSSSTPVSVTGLSDTATQIVTTNRHTCALLDSGSVECWGSNNEGRLGDGNTELVLGCWDGDQFQSWASDKNLCELYGYEWTEKPAPTDSPTPVAVSGVTNATQITGGSHHTCVLLSGGTAECWGDNYAGQLGGNIVDTLGCWNGASTAPFDETLCGIYGYEWTTKPLPTDSPTPVAVSGITNATQISAGTGTTCALLSDATARCWGDNYGKLGNGLTDSSTTPVTVLAEGEPVGGAALAGINRIDVGGYHTCAILGSGASSAAKCWGNGGSGQLGDATTSDSLTPVIVLEEGEQANGAALTGITHLDAGLESTCVALTDGTAKCWGYNGSGQLGDGTQNTDRLTPVTVDGLDTVTGFPATVDVTVTDNNGSATETITLTVD